jgi:hypothetical protein
MSLFTVPKTVAKWEILFVASSPRLIVRLDQTGLQGTLVLCKILHKLRGRIVLL